MYYLVENPHSAAKDPSIRPRRKERSTRSTRNTRNRFRVFRVFCGFCPSMILILAVVAVGMAQQIDWSKKTLQSERSRT